jgi:hypothetical protein
MILTGKTEGVHHKPTLTGPAANPGLCNEWPATTDPLFKLRLIHKVRTELCSGFFGPCLHSGILRRAVSLTYTDVCVLSTLSKRWWWRQYAPLKRRSTSTRLHGTKSQKAVCHLQCYLQFANVRRSEVVCLLHDNGTSSGWYFKFSRRRVWCSELSSGLYCRVKWLSTDVSEVRTASIIIIPEDSSERPSGCFRQCAQDEIFVRKRSEGGWRQEHGQWEAF